MVYTQRLPITTKLRGPFVVSIVPRALNQKTIRKTFRCAYKACKYLKDKDIDSKLYYGGDVGDQNGKIIAEKE